MAKRRPLSAPVQQSSPVQDLIRTAQEALDGPLLVYWTPPENTITMEDGQVLRQIMAGMPKTDTLYLCLSSSGGNGQASLPIVRQLRQRCRRLVVLVPIQAASAATMIALGADEVHLGTCAYLTPVDTSLNHPLAPTFDEGKTVSVGQDEVSRVLALWKKADGSGTAHPLQHLFPFIHPLVIGAVERSNSLSQKICDSLLAYHTPDPDVRKAIVNALVESYPSHGYPILLEEAASIGIKATAMDPLVESYLVELIGMLTSQKLTTVDDEDDGSICERKTMTVIEREGLKATYSRRTTSIWVDDDDEENGGHTDTTVLGTGWQLHEDGGAAGVDIAIED